MVREKAKKKNKTGNESIRFHVIIEIKGFKLGLWVLGVKCSVGLGLGGCPFKEGGMSL